MGKYCHFRRSLETVLSISMDGDRLAKAHGIYCSRAVGPVSPRTDRAWLNGGFPSSKENGSLHTLSLPEMKAFILTRKAASLFTKAV